MRVIDLTKAALIVIDMQHDFYGKGGNAARRGKAVEQMRSLPAKIAEFADGCRGAGAKVVFTKFVFDPDASPANYKELTDDVRESNWLCLKGSKGSELDGVKVGSGDLVLEKPYYDSFASTNLKEMLVNLGVRDVIITGVRTEICVNATATRSFSEGFRTFVASDLVGTYDGIPDTASGVLAALKYSAFVMESAAIRNAFAIAKPK
jgi:nicotinamidase-related amidase